MYFFEFVLNDLYILLSLVLFDLGGLFTFTQFYLFIIVFAPLLGVVILFISGSSVVSFKLKESYSFFICQFLSTISVISTCFLIYYYNEGFTFFQYNVDVSWLEGSIFESSLHLGFDGLSLSLICLTNLLVLGCIVTAKTTVTHNVQLHLICFQLLQLLLTLAFSVLDIFWFYIFFESILIPMFLLIGIWGSRKRRIKATYMLFIYTALGSLLLLVSIIFFYYTIGSTDVRVLYLINFPFSVEKVLFVFIFISFCIKTPMFPFHIWLPEAHVEASTTGSMILAGILLKLGTYGMIRFLLPLFPDSIEYFSLLVILLSLVGMVIVSFIILSQIDLKKIIAYASVAHMATAVVGLFTNTVNGYIGSILMVIGHGFVAAGLFFCIGALYARYHTRLITYYSNLVQKMPLFTILFCILTFMNIGFPGTVGFASEFLVMSSLEQTYSVTLSLFFIAFLVTVVYSIWLFNRICFMEDTTFLAHYDITPKELSIILSFIVMALLLGLVPGSFISIL